MFIYNDQTYHKYDTNFGCDRFILDDNKNIKGGDLLLVHLSWASSPCQDLSLAGSIDEIYASRSRLV